MPHISSQVLHRKLDKKLWNSADRLGLIIKERGRLAHPNKITSTGKHIADALKNTENNLFADPADYATRGGGLHPPSPNKSLGHFHKLIIRSGLTDSGTVNALICCDDRTKKIYQPSGYGIF